MVTFFHKIHSSRLLWVAPLLLLGVWMQRAQAQTCPANLGSTVTIASLPYTGTALTTCGAGNDITSANATVCGSGSYYGGEDLVFTFTPTVSGNITLTITSASSWIGMMLYNGCPFLGQGGACVTYVQSSSGSPTMTGVVTAGVTYYLVVDTWPTPTCIPSFNLTITAPTPPPTCATLGVNVTLPYNGVGLTNCGAGNDLTSSNVSPICGSTNYYGGEDQMYIFTPSVTGSTTITFTSSSSWVGLMLYSGCPLAGNGATCVGFAQSSSGNQTITATLTAGVTYYLIVDSWPTPTCHPSYNLSITPPAPPYDPCASITSLTCGTAVTASPTGSGVWSPGSCGFTTPGKELVYSFTPANSGSATLQVNSTNAGGYIDYFFKPASGGCSSTGWTCIDDVFSAGTASFTVVGGTTYYILLDPETTTAVTQNFQVNCPTLVPVCVSAPTAPANAATNICPSTAVTLSWPSVAGATSYDVYFGTTSTPAFVGNTTNTTWALPAQTAGLKYWQIIPRNSTGTATGCTVFTFTVGDAIAPTIVCPASSTINNVTNTCSATVTYGAITATDNCTAPAISLQSGIASNTVQPVGVYTIVYKATDASANTATCSFTVTVKDAQAPTITCPASINTNASVGLCSATPTFSVTANDNCAAPSITLSQNPGTAFPVGTTTVTATATDAASNIATCSFTVTVVDNQPPTITCPPTINQVNDPGECGREISYLGQLSFNDNCAVVSSVIPSQSYFNVGTTVVTYSVKDGAGNSAQCNQTVNVRDYEFPGITCPTHVDMSATPGECGSASVDFGVTGQDNCGGISLSYDPPTSTFLEIGTHVVTAYVSDDAGNVSSCNMLVYVAPLAEICDGEDNDCDGYTDEAQNWVRAAKRTVRNGFNYQHYGQSVAIDGSWAIVGSRQLNTGATAETGSAYILNRNSGGANSWGTVLRLQPADLENGDAFGHSVAIYGHYAAVGAPGDDDAGTDAGAVYVYEQDAADASAWNMIKKLTASDSDGVDSFGYSVALNGSELLVGAPNQAGHGAAYLYGKNQGGSNNWGEVGSWAASDADNGDRFGADVDLHGNRAIVGAPGDDAKGTNAGAAYRYNRGSNGWAFGAKLTMGQGAAGDAAGTSVAVHGANLLVGAPYSNLKANNGGAVFAFTYDNANNVPVLDNNGSANDHFGTDVAVDSNYLAISAPNDDPTGANSGKVFVFIRDQSGWNRLASVNDIYAIDNDHFGNALALSGQTLIVGEYTDGVGTIPEQGSILVFDGVCPTGDRPDQAFVDRNEMENTNDLPFEVTCSPVPFSDMLSIQVGQETPETVHVSILNALGQTVVELNKQHFVGNGRFVWQANTNQQGVFFVRVQSGNSVQTKPVMRVTEK